MNSLNIDFRGESIRILTVRDNRIGRAVVIENFSISDKEKAKSALLKAIEDAGGKKGKVNIILPNNIVKYKTYQLPAMDIEDANKIIRRQLSKELGHQNFSMGVRRVLKNLAGKQELLSEYAMTTDIQAYLDLLKTCGIKPSVLTTGLEGIINLFNKIRPETNGNEAVLEVGRNFIEIAVFNNGKLVNYKKIQMAQVNNEKLADKDLGPDQINKIKMYTIVDALYNFVMEAESSSEENKISHLWISGLGAIEHGTTGCVTEGLGVDCTMMNPIDIDVEHPCIYSAIAGVSMLQPTDTIVNLLSEEIKSMSRSNISRVILAASLSIYAILLAGGYLLLTSFEKDARAVYDKAIKEQAALKRKFSADTKFSDEGIRHISKVDIDLYPIFRDIADIIPDGVSLTLIEIDNSKAKASIHITATTSKSGRESGPGMLLRFAQSLENTGRLRMTGIPDISHLQQQGKTGATYSMKAVFEALK